MLIQLAEPVPDLLLDGRFAVPFLDIEVSLEHIENGQVRHLAAVVETPVREEGVLARGECVLELQNEPGFGAGKMVAA